MTERELILRAKTFRANSYANSDKITYADALKVVLLSELVDRGKEFSAGELELILKLVQMKKRAWYRFW
jgi:hypothetical protein